MSSRREQKEALRRDRDARQSAQSAAEQRRRRLVGLGVAVAAAAIVLVTGIALSQSGSDDGGSPAEDTAAVREEFEGIPQKGNVLGEPDAPATLVEYGDLQCPACAAYSNDTLPQVLKRFVRPGRVKLELRLVAIIGPESQLAAETAAAASLQDGMWQFSDVFYRNQGVENSGYVTEDFLAEIAAATPGLDGPRTVADSGSPRARAIAARWASQAQRASLSATPTFVLQRAGAAPEQVAFTPDLIDTLDGLLPAR